MNDYIAGGVWGYTGVFGVRRVHWGLGRQKGVKGVLVAYWCVSVTNRCFEMKWGVAVQLGVWCANMLFGVRGREGGC